MIRGVFCVLMLIAPSVADACDVKLLNSSGVDLSISLDGGKSILIAPSEAVSVSYSALRFIEFGAIEHEYAIGKNKSTLCPGETHGDIEVEARKDGQLWLRCNKQLKPFPLAPKRMRDLTNRKHGSENNFPENPGQRTIS